MSARFYDALTAESSCKAGAFTIYGFQLVPLSLWHSVVLTQLGNTAWIGGDIRPTDLLVAASIFGIVFSRNLQNVSVNYLKPMWQVGTASAWEVGYLLHRGS